MCVGGADCTTPYPLPKVLFSITRHDAITGVNHDRSKAPRNASNMNKSLRCSHLCASSIGIGETGSSYIQGQVVTEAFYENSTHMEIPSTVVG